MDTYKKGYSKTDEIRRNNAKKCIYTKKGLFLGQFSTLYFRECVRCDTKFIARSVAHQACHDCRAKRIKNRKVNLRKEKGVCLVCGITFLGIVSDNIVLKRTCSVKCNTYLYRIENGISSENHRSRAKRKGSIIEGVKNNDVFKRDKYICQCCGIKCNPKKTRTFENDSPRLDHIIPINKGGAHTFGNVQTLCFPCNAKKSDKINGQLPLFFTNNIGETQVYAIREK